MSLVIFRRAEDLVRHMMAAGWTLTQIDTSALNGSGEFLTCYEWEPPAGEVVSVCPDCATRNAVLLDQLAESQAARRELELRVASMVLGARSDNDAR